MQFLKCNKNVSDFIFVRFFFYFVKDCFGSKKTKTLIIMFVTLQWQHQTDHHSDWDDDPFNVVTVTRTPLSFPLPSSFLSPSLSPSSAIVTICRSVFHKVFFIYFLLCFFFTSQNSFIHSLLMCGAFFLLTDASLQYLPRTNTNYMKEKIKRHC